MQFKEAKQHIRDFMRNHYSDEKLCALLAHAQEGKLSYFSCCCFIGVATADHALWGQGSSGNGHYQLAKQLDGGEEAELAFAKLCDHVKPKSDTSFAATRRRILIPMIRAEQRRRERQYSGSTLPDIDALVEGVLQQHKERV